MEKKPWLARIYNGVYYPVMWGFIKANNYEDPYKPTNEWKVRGVFFSWLMWHQSNYHGTLGCTPNGNSVPGWYLACVQPWDYSWG